MGTVLTVRTGEPDPRAPPAAVTIPHDDLARLAATRDPGTTIATRTTEGEEEAPIRDGSASITKMRHLHEKDTPTVIQIAQSPEAAMTI